LVYQASHIKRQRATKAEIEERRDELFSIVAAMHPMTVRQVFYQATIRGIVEKSEAGYAKVQTDLKRGDGDGVSARRRRRSMRRLSSPSTGELFLVRCSSSCASPTRTLTARSARGWLPPMPLTSPSKNGSVASSARLSSVGKQRCASCGPKQLD
jgi:hypothetical protein